MFIENHWPETHTNWLMSPQYSTYSQEMRGDILIRIPGVCCDIIFTMEKDIPLMSIPCAFITTILVGYYHLASLHYGASKELGKMPKSKPLLRCNIWSNFDETFFGSEGKWNWQNIVLKYFLSETIHIQENGSRGTKSIIPNSLRACAIVHCPTNSIGM